MVRADRPRARGEDSRAARIAARARSQGARSEDRDRAFARTPAMLDINLLRNDLARVASPASPSAASRSMPRASSRSSANARTSRRARRSCRRSATRCRSRSARRRARARTPPRCWRKSPASATRRSARERARPRAGASCATFLLDLPNLTHASTPVGKIRGRQRRGPPLGHAAHVRLSGAAITPTSAKRLGLLDFATAAKLSGARFSFLRGGLARLHRALAQFMLDVADARAWLHRVLHALHRQRRDADRHDAAAEVRSRHVLGDEGRCAKARASPLYLISTSEITLTNTRSRRDPAGGRAADQAHRAYALLPLRGRQLRQGHARHDPPAPVRQGRDGADRAPGRRRTRRSRR